MLAFHFTQAPALRRTLCLSFKRLLHPRCALYLLKLCNYWTCLNPYYAAAWFAKWEWLNLQLKIQTQICSLFNVGICSVGILTFTFSSNWYTLSYRYQQWKTIESKLYIPPFWVCVCVYLQVQIKYEIWSQICAFNVKWISTIQRTIKIRTFHHPLPFVSCCRK